MKLKIVELLGAFKTAYVSHLAVSVTATALAGVLAIGGTGYGIYSATTKEAPAEVVAEAVEAPSEEAPVVSAKTEEVSAEKAEAKTAEKTTEKKATEKVSEKKEEKVETKETSEKVTSKTTEKASEKTTEKASSSAAESKKENAKTESKASAPAKTETKTAAPAKTETKTATPAKTETAKEEAPKTHTHTWVHHAEVTMPQYEMQYVVDVPAWDEPVTSTYTEPVKNTETMIVDGGTCLPGTVVLGYREVTNTYMSHHDEEGHMEKVQVGTTVLEAAYDECAECGARR